MLGVARVRFNLYKVGKKGLTERMFEERLERNWGNKQISSKQQVKDLDRGGCLEVCGKVAREEKWRVWSENSGAQRDRLAQLYRNFLLPVLFFFTELTLSDIILHIYYYIDFLSLSPSLEKYAL